MTFCLTFAKKEVKKMPTTMPGRKLVKKYLANNHIKITDLAKMYGLSKQDATEYISGRKTNSKANQYD
jgi:plasmid maintenance system antidote protein VapI